MYILVDVSILNFRTCIMKYILVDVSSLICRIRDVQDLLVYVSILNYFWRLFGEKSPAMKRALQWNASYACSPPCSRRVDSQRPILHYSVYLSIHVSILNCRTCVVICLLVHVSILNCRTCITVYILVYLSILNFRTLSCIY